MTKPRILFMGTPAFAVWPLQGLVRCGYPVIGVVTQPDRPQGRGRLTAPPAVKLVAESLNLPLLQPEKVREPLFLDVFRRLSPDLVIVAAFGQILPGELIHAAPEGCINIHPSLLPKYRGAAPINWALIRGEQKTGVTIMQMDEGVDSGAILLQRETPIGAEETFGELHDRLAILGSDLLIHTLEMLESGTLRPQPQNESLATYAPRLQQEDGLIAWKSDCQKIVSLIRGLSPLPTAYTYLNGKKLKIFKAVAEPATIAEAPGAVALETADLLRVAAGNGYVLIHEVQLEGKRRMAVRDFLLGCRIAVGQVLG